MHTPTRNTLAFIIGFTTTLAVGACVTVRATKLGSHAHPHAGTDEIVIYRTEAQVPGPYEEIALLDATSEPIATSDARVYAKMRRKAAVLGANAIVLTPTPTPTQPTSERVATLSLGMPLPRRLKATAIRIDEVRRND